MGAGVGQRALRCFPNGQAGRLLILVDQMNEGLDQIVVDLAKPVVGKAQQIQARDGDRHPLQLVDGVELHERRVIPAAFRGNSGGLEEASGELMQRREEFPAPGFLTQFLVAEVLCLMLEDADPVHRFIGAQHGVERLRDLRGEGVAEQAGHAPALRTHDTVRPCLAETCKWAQRCAAASGTGGPRAE
ncbi:hypothetical protein R69746_08831 [Paraburkholderia aspalathi]|nr:hypothetical protein R75465_08643 [Paraburkholderia aspalathi]CAE6876924.1 hypothetical protein R69746_08831 [Paraburkholderia aspalathi]